MSNEESKIPPLSDKSICLAKFTPSITDDHCHDCNGNGQPCFHRDAWNLDESEMLERMEELAK